MPESMLAGPDRAINGRLPDRGDTFQNDPVGPEPEPPVTDPRPEETPPAPPTTVGTCSAEASQGLTVVESPTDTARRLVPAVTADGTPAAEAGTQTGGESAGPGVLSDHAQEETSEAPGVGDVRVTTASPESAKTKAASKRDGGKNGATPKVDVKSAEKVMEEIQDQQLKLGKNEGAAVQIYVTIGALLVTLKSRSGKKWAEMLETLGYNPRVARRLQKIGKAWGGKNGRIASDLLPRVSQDVNKLEWLCELSEEQLRAVVGNLGCRKASRGEVIAAVKNALGKEPAASAPKADAALKSFERLVDRLVKCVERLKGGGLHGGFQDGLNPALEKLRAALTPPTTKDTETSST